VLYNAWDAGSARSVLEAGAKAIATKAVGRSLAGARLPGRRSNPMNASRRSSGDIAASVDALITVDFEWRL